MIFPGQGRGRAWGQACAPAVREGSTDCETHFIECCVKLAAFTLFTLMHVGRQCKGPRPTVSCSPPVTAMSAGSFCVCALKPGNWPVPSNITWKGWQICVSLVETIRSAMRACMYRCTCHRKTSGRAHVTFQLEAPKAKTSKFEVLLL